MKIKIAEAFGDTCINGTKAKSFADNHIVPLLKEGKKVTIDFTGVKYSSSSFINSMIFNTYGYEIIENQVNFKADDEFIQSMIEDSISSLEKEL